MKGGDLRPFACNRRLDLAGRGLAQFKLLDNSRYLRARQLQTVPVVAIAQLILLWTEYNEHLVAIISFTMSLPPVRQLA